jgi:hypothetical protein
MVYELNSIERAVVEAFAGDEITDRDIQDADETPDEWCAECIGRRAAAVNATRIALEAAFAAGMVPLADVLDALRDEDAVFDFATRFGATADSHWAGPLTRAQMCDYLAERFAPTTAPEGDRPRCDCDPAAHLDLHRPWCATQAAPEGADERNGHG